MGTRRGHEALLSEQGEIRGIVRHIIQRSGEIWPLFALYFPEKWPQTVQQVSGSVARLSAGGVSKLHPGFVDKWEDALHLRDQCFRSRLYNQAGWYDSLSEI